MIDWTKSMTQSFEYYEVNPISWKDSKKLSTIISASINRTNEKETLGNATIDCVGSFDECYIRGYLIATQGEETERIPLATVMAQTPSESYDGRKRTVSMDCYTPLIELKEKLPDLGFFVPKGTDPVAKALELIKSNLRAPVFGSSNNLVNPLTSDFVANPDDTWLSYISNLLLIANYEMTIDENGTILVGPIQKMASMQPRWDYDDGNSSILYPDVTDSRDIYGIPNVVEVVYSDEMHFYYAKAYNNDPNSVTSIQRRGREIHYRETAPDISGNVEQEAVDKYAIELLKKLSTVEHSLSYKHGYTPVRVGDCVRLNYARAGIKNVKARVVSQSIDCSTGCAISETAVYTEALLDEEKIKIENRGDS